MYDIHSGQHSSTALIPKLSQNMGRGKCPFLSNDVCQSRGIAVAILICKLDSQFKLEQMAVKGDSQWELAMHQEKGSF